MAHMPIIKTSEAVCNDCIHYHKHTEMCGYCLDTGMLRAFKDGKQYLKRGECDKYEPKTTTMRRYKTADELFGNSL